MKLKDQAHLIIDIEKMVADAEKKYNDAARMHFPGKVSFEAGRRDALKAVLQLFETV